MPSKHTLALVIGLSLSTTAMAEEYRQHDAHEHGHVEFNIAQDGKDLLVEITAPGADVVGFEHALENAEQEQQLKQAVAKLEDTSSLFTINSQAECDIADVHVEHTLGGAHDEHEGHDHDEHHDEHKDHDHSDHDEHEHHDDHADHANHDDHDDHEGHDHDAHSSHGEFSAQYRFNCEKVSELSTIKTAWFNQFPNTESVSVNLFTDTTQSATSLNKDNAEIVIK
ncbi:zinc uptake protein ZrgA [Vibrio natriegens]|uniref:zinc uptake protein ZrgA n=1 Tax=Vibrio natriegens TaxID=691 RepID=UPI003909DEA7